LYFLLPLNNGSLQPSLQRCFIFFITIIVIKKQRFSQYKKSLVGGDRLFTGYGGLTGRNRLYGKKIDVRNPSPPTKIQTAKGGLQGTVGSLLYGNTPAHLDGLGINVGGSFDISHETTFNMCVLCDLLSPDKSFVTTHAALLFVA
jgi:hypothetical protein